MPDETSAQTPKEVKVSVDYLPGRWGQVYHIFDCDGREIALQRNDAVKMARKVLSIAKEGKESK